MSSTTSPADSPAPEPTAATDKSVPKCRFNDCDNLSVDGTDKCAFHKNRRQCCVDNCTNQVYARKLCVRHGGKKQCQADGCEAHARGGGYCLQHGGFVVKRFCIVEGCSRQAHARQKCVRHGGGRRCKVDGCMQHARAGGLCNRHSHGHQCRIEGCKKTAQHSGSICFRHAMELRAHGEQVPELNISKGGRLSSKKRQQLQREQQLKQEQFHHQQLQQQQLQQQQQQQQSSTSTASTTTQSSQSSAAPGPFGLPLKINVPTTMPKFTSLKTPLGGFPTPRSHEFSLLMGLPSPQIDHSQLPSVLAMANQQRSIYESSGLTPSFMGPPSITRGQRTPGTSFLSLGIFPTPTGDKSLSSSSHPVEEDLDAIINNYNKFMGPGTASPIAYHHQTHQYAPPPPLLENIGLNVFDQNGQPVHPHAAALHARNQLAAQAAAVHGASHLQRLKMDFPPPQQGGVPQAYEGYSNGHVEGSNDYTAQFFADNNAAAADKARAGVKVSAAAPKATGVAAA
ncbi:hypothetical protein Poli38472_005023 [Pythium oligandrum]|uniref:Uncharacterized protein n=1 Tax=Pythium oligandrum TaxID=41045 RepID=A0A8K1FGF3_PYTOL|nr:hypothetical protein Poli38472_005023 [Pythium oligandrum]|eukprot:TMW59954.1 hypothetical protein Poli38472_005023 [Pythium oligandrum]